MSSLALLADVLASLRQHGCPRAQSLAAVAAVAGREPSAELAGWLAEQQAAWPAEDEPNWREVFLMHLRRTGCVRIACDLACVSAPRAYRLRWQDAAFQAAWSAAIVAYRGRRRGRRPVAA